MNQQETTTNSTKTQNQQVGLNRKWLQPVTILVGLLRGSQILPTKLQEGSHWRYTISSHNIFSVATATFCIVHWLPSRSLW